jgi:hypothetical protein
VLLNLIGLSFHPTSLRQQPPVDSRGDKSNRQTANLNAAAACGSCVKSSDEGFLLVGRQATGLAMQNHREGIPQFTSRIRKHITRPPADVIVGTDKDRSAIADLAQVEPIAFAGNRSLLVGVGRDQARVHRESFTADKTFVQTSLHDSLKQVPQDIALPEPAMTVAREGGTVRHPAVKSQATKPAIGEVRWISSHSLRSDRIAVQ